MTFIQDRIDLLATATGLDGASMRIVICLLLSFPFSAVFKRLPDANYRLKNYYIIAVSSFYIFGILNLHSGFRTLLISAMGTYLLTRYLKTPLMPWINFVFVMSHLAFNHVHAQFFKVYDPTTIDITGAQMVLVMKLSAFGWNIHDARAQRKNKDLPLSSYLKSRVIEEHPGLVEFLGYTFFYPSLLTGPAFDFADYHKFIHSTLFDDLPDNKKPGRTRKRKIPKSGRVALRKVAQGIFWAAVWIKIGDYVTVEDALDPVFKYERSFVYKVLYLWILGFTYRLKYYAVWLIAEAGCIVCGIGYNGYDAKTGTILWNRVQNVDPYAFETGQNVHVCLEAWNQNTNKWLKNYVYMRVVRPGKKPGFKSSLFTFLTSAFWHGTRPGYYMAFACGAFLQSCQRLYRRNFRPIFLEADGKTAKPSKVYYDIVCYFVTQLAFGYVVHPFVILDIERSLYLWGTVHYYFHAMVAVTYFVFMGPFKKQVTDFLKQFQASANAKATPKTAVLKDESEEPVMVLPDTEVFLNIGEVKEGMDELRDQFQTMKRRGSLVESGVLEDAYKNFSEEVSSFFPKKD
ncbi:hypothetical protein BABINDRAFT_169849 [Babjeviella inositovora NRRL Y-12698]|uniref:Lysophospholipid acyltransferase n=1 Tax=Babjeviella inositovora NRRL Y-12698 TaxID=984486 RepID=A0A1E3QY45_9ASCO|nr:uncharacterized protein BABINDRAFT_169849 [Babjeviella inositovora NRRL Y-12698]ODQ82599.1 hypothetical protein BABINDRAFT_169849 [Babjeviella inositovora NRRL Y-12698]